MGQIILGIVLFALVTAVLYVWGLKKSMTQQEDLDRALLRKSAERVNRYLKAHDTIDRAEMARLVEGVRVGLFWSRQKAAVQDPRAFAPKLARYLTEQLLVSALPGGRFRLR